jgi:hypothetical protein
MHLLFANLGSKIAPSLGKESSTRPDYTVGVDILVNSGQPMLRVRTCSGLLEEVGDASLSLFSRLLALRCAAHRFRCRLQLLRLWLVLREGLPDRFFFGD